MSPRDTRPRPRRDGRDGRGDRRPAVAAEESAQAHITAIAAGGDGVARVDGLATFVPRTAPGDVAQIAMRRQARHARGRVLQLLERSAARVEPRCRHYVADRCGGCQLQHVAADAQVAARSQIVADALRRIGKREVPPPPVVRGEEWAYRGRLTLTLLRRGSRWVGGLHPYDDPTRVFMLEECPIAHPTLVAVWHALRPLLSGLPDERALRLGLRLAGSDDDNDAPAGRVDRVAVVVSGGREWPQQAAWAAQARAAHPAVATVLWERARDDGVALNAQGHVDDLAPHAAEALAFAQVNGGLADALRDFVLSATLAFTPAHVVDGYAGIGLLSHALAARGVRVTAIESDPAATAAARERLQGHTHATVHTATVEAALDAALPADVVVVNPPRRGLDPKVTALLASTDPARTPRAVVYVSCDPATLARDVSRLPGWRIADLKCFDMFPQTAHVETVLVLVPERT